MLAWQVLPVPEVCSSLEAQQRHRLKALGSPQKGSLMALGSTQKGSLLALGSPQNGSLMALGSPWTGHSPSVRWLHFGSCLPQPICVAGASQQRSSSVAACCHPTNRSQLLTPFLTGYERSWTELLRTFLSYVGRLARAMGYQNPLYL